MKKIIVSAIIMVLLLSCGGGPSNPILGGVKLELKSNRHDGAYDKLSKGLYGKLGKNDKDAQALRAIPEAWYEMAKLHKRKKEIDKAVSAVAKAEELDTTKRLSKDITDLKRSWANIDHRKGVETYNAALSLEGDQKAAKLKEAKTNLESSLKVKEKAEVYIVLGKAEEQLDNFSGAESAYKKAIALEDTNSNHLFDLATLYYNNKKYEEAITQFDKTIGLDSKHKNALKYKAFAYQNMKQYDKAEASYTALLAVYPTDEDSKANLAILKTNRIKDEAFAIVAEYNKLIEKKKPNMKKANALLKTSVPMLESLVKTEFYKENFSMWSQLFTVYARLGMKKEAKMAEKKLKTLE